MKKAASFLAILFAVASCHRDGNLSTTDYLKYMDDPSHAMKRIVKTGTVEYSTQLATPEYMACKELMEQAGENKGQKINSRINELKGTVFFLVKCARSKKEESVMQTMQQKAGAQNMVMYYQDAENDFTLFNGASQSKPVVYHFEDNYGLAPYNTIVVGFNVPDLKTDMKLVFNDRLNDNPLVQFSYSKKEIEQIPSLKL